MHLNCNDLISRQAAIDAMRKHEVELPIYTPREVDIFWDDAIDACCEAVETLPPAQPDLSTYSDKLWRAAYERGRKEAERRRGKWTKENACEICGFQPWYERDIHTLSFCPHCGADMREDDKPCS